jgi:hypothetical protein
MRKLPTLRRRRKKRTSLRLPLSRSSLVPKSCRKSWNLKLVMPESASLAAISPTFEFGHYGVGTQRL